MYSSKNLAIIGVLLIAVLYQYLGNSEQNGTNGNNQTTATHTDSRQRSTPTPAALATSVEQIRKAADDPQARFWTTVSGTVIRNPKMIPKAAGTRSFWWKLHPA